MNPFEYVIPKKVEDVPSLLGKKRGRETAVIAGGVDLIGEMKDNLVAPDRLVNLKALPELKYIKHSGSKVRIGALTTLTEIVNDPKIQNDYAALAEASGSVGSLQIRNVGTIGGNLCQRPRCWYYRTEEFVCLKKGGWECFAASGNNKYNAIIAGGPSYIVHPSDLAPALVALDAKITIRGPEGGRTIPLSDFFVLPEERLSHETVLKSDEIVTEVTVPHPRKMRSTYLKFKEKESMDWALSAVAAAIQIEGGVCRSVRIVLGGVAPVPWRVQEAEAALVGRAVTPPVLEHVAEVALRGAEPLSHNAYKIPLTKTLIRRAIQAVA